MILFAACSKEDLQVSPTIEGFIQISEGNSSAITSPAEGIRVYLADASQGLQVEKSMIVDSTYTAMDIPIPRKIIKTNMPFNWIGHQVI